jgi:membrane fusion protein, heavy metal efflux system
MYTTIKSIQSGQLTFNRVPLLSTLIWPLMFLFILAGCGSSPDDETVAEKSEPETSLLESEVHLTSVQIDDLGIQVVPLEAGSAVAVLERPATLMLDQDRHAKIGPRLSAKVVTVLKDLGDEVRVGDPLALMSSVELGTHKAEYLTSRAHFRSTKAAFEREEDLFKKGISSEAEALEAAASFEEARAGLEAEVEALRLFGLTLDEIENLRGGGDEPMSYFRLESSVNGVVQKRDLVPGETIGPNDTPIHVARVDELWLMIDAFEQDVPYLKTGQRVDFKVRSLSGKTFEGVTDWVSWVLNDKTRTVQVRAIVKNPGGLLRAGMFGTARLFTQADETFAMIPVDAVQTLEGTKVVFVPGDSDGSFRPVPVELGRESVSEVEILSGLVPGDLAVVAGAFDVMSAMAASSFGDDD